MTHSNDYASTSSEVSGDYEIPDPDFIDTALEEMAQYGGSQGVKQHALIKALDTRLLVDNSINTYGRGEWEWASTWDWIIGGKRIPTIRLNAYRLFDEGLQADRWRISGISPNDYITKTVQTLYHESGHLYGLWGREYLGVYKTGPYRYFSPSELAHPLGGFHTIWEHDIGRLTRDWLLNVYLKNKR